MNKKYKVGAYLRLSQEDEEKDVSNSIINQKNIIERKIEELGKEFFIMNYYIDDGFTGLNTNRPDFQRMMADIEKGIINCIITKDLSRFSRNSFEANYYLDLYFVEKNIRYISILDNIDTETKKYNNEIIQFKNLINDWYSKDISRKIKSSIWARKENGMYICSFAPYGYRKCKNDKNKLEIYWPEARIIKRIFKEYDESKPITKIVKELQENKIQSPNNNKNIGEIRYNWRIQTVKAILTNQVYLGNTQYGKRINLSYKSKKRKYIRPDEWKIVYNTHEAIIDQELFNRVQNKVHMNKKVRIKKHEWKLNGLVNCKECGEKMTLKVKYNKNKPEEIKSKKVYCLNGIKKKCIKGSRGIDEDILNKIVSENLRKVIKNEQIMQSILRANYKCKQNYIEKQKELICKELYKKENEIKILYEDYKEKLLDNKDYKKFYKDMINQKRVLKMEIKNLENEERVNFSLNGARIKKILKEITNSREVISSIIDSIEVDNNNNIFINYRYNIF